MTDYWEMDKGPEQDLAEFEQEGHYFASFGSKHPLNVTVTFDEDAYSTSKAAEQTRHLRRQELAKDAKEDDEAFGFFTDALDSGRIERPAIDPEREEEFQRLQDKRRRNEKKINRLFVEGKKPEYTVLIDASDLCRGKGEAIAMGEAKRWAKFLRDEMESTGKYHRWGVAEINQGPKKGDYSVVVMFTTDDGIKPKEFKQDFDAAVAVITQKFDQLHQDKIGSRELAAQSLAFEAASTLLDRYKDRISPELLPELRRDIIKLFEELRQKPIAPFKDHSR